MKTNFVIFLYFLILFCHCEEECTFNNLGKCRLKRSLNKDEDQNYKSIMLRMNEIESTLLNAFSRLEEKCKGGKEANVSIDLKCVNLPAISSTGISSDDLCDSASCKKAASYLLEAINPNVDPCDNFFEFSCGKWIESHPNTNALTLQTQEKSLQMLHYVEKEANDPNLPASIKKILDLYKLCKEYDGITDSLLTWIRTKLVGIGGWPMTENIWWKDEWKSLFTKAFLTTPVTGPINIRVAYDPFNTENNIIHIKQPLIEENQKINTQAVLQYAKLLSSKSNETIHEDMKEVEWMEGLIANLSKSYQTLINDPMEARSMTIEQLERIIPTVDWVHLLRDILQPYLKSTSIITKDTEIFVLGITYLRTIVNYLDSGRISSKLLANYLSSLLINSIAKTFSATMNSEVKQQSPVNPQTEKCFTSIFSYACHVMEYIYSKNRKEKLLERKMVSYMVEAMREMVNKSPWLDEATREKVLEKLDGAHVLVGFPPWISDPKEMDEYYRYFPSLSDNPLENNLNLMNYMMSKDLQLITVKNDRSQWPKISEICAYNSNAFYNHDQNQIVILAGIQSLPIFDAERPSYMNFGGMGSVVGHEITHGFDKIGSLKDNHGNMKNWWTDKAKAEFESRAKCFIDQYDAFNYGRSGYETLSENIADNGGIRQSYLAYKKWVAENGKEKILPCFEGYTPEQLFFLSMARSWCDSTDPVELAKLVEDNHSASKFRVLATLRNMKEFSETFQCKVGSNMNPSHKCTIW